MSHFKLIVITKEEPTAPVLTAAMAPYHRYEATGVDDEYVIDVDITERERAIYESRLKGSCTFEEYINDSYALDCPERGRLERDESGEITRVIYHTNPNAEWDSWRVGGRWDGELRTKEGYRRNVLRRSDYDFDGICRDAEEEAWEIYRNAIEHVSEADLKAVHSLEELQAEHVDGNEARAAFYAQPVVCALKGSIMFTTLLSVDIPLLRDGPDRLAAHLRNRRLAPYALLTPAHGWQALGSMSMLDRSEHRMPREEWEAKAYETLRDTPPDHWLTIAECRV